MAAEQNPPHRVVHTYNPLVHAIAPLPQHTTDQVQSLFSLCIRCTQKHVTLRNLRFLQSPELPTDLYLELTRLNLADFHVNPAHVTRQDHVQKTYPATCLLDGSLTHLCVNPHANNEAILQDPAYITYFPVRQYFIYVLVYTDNLEQHLEKLREMGETIPEEEIWRTLCDVITIADKANLVVLHPSRLRVMDGKIFCRIPFNGDDTERCTLVPAVRSTNSTAVYEAPEILERNAPCKESLSWSLGCIAYELATLTPAYYDRLGTGNMMIVIAEMIHGIQPQSQPENCSNDLKNIIVKCLKKDPSERPSLEEIRILAREHL